MSKKYILIVFILLTAAFQVFSRVYDKNLDIYFYSIEKASSFLKTDAIDWAYKNKEYIKIGISLPVTFDGLNEEMKTKFGKVSYYNKPEMLYIYLTMEGDVDSAPLINIIEKEYDKLKESLSAGNKILAGIYLGTLTRYVVSIALWPYYMGERSVFGEADPLTAEEYFNEMDRLLKSNQIYKLDNQIKFDKFLNRNIRLKNEIPLLLNKLVINDRDNTYNCVELYKKIPLTNLILNTVTYDKDMSGLSGDLVGYRDWDEYVFTRSGKNLSIAINLLTDIISTLPQLNKRPRVRIEKIQVIPSKYRIDLRWPSVEDNAEISRQIIYISEDGLNWSEVVSLGRSSSGYSITNLENDVKYFFKVVMLDITGRELSSQTVEGVPTDRKSPEEPGKLTADAKDMKVLLKWTRSRSEDTKKYLIYVYRAGKLVRNYEVNNNVTEFLVENLENNIEYTFRVSAVDEFPNESRYLEKKAVPVDITAPEKISNLKVEGSNGTLRVSWKLSDNSEKDAEMQKLTLYENKKIRKELDIPPDINEYSFYGLKNDNVYKVGITVRDEANNRSDTVYDEYKLIYRGKLFFQDKSFKLSVTDYPYFCYMNDDFYLDFIFVDHNLLKIAFNQDGEAYKIVETNIEINKILQIFTADLDMDNIPEIIINDSGNLKVLKKQDKFFYYRDIVPYTAIYLNKKFRYITHIDYNKDEYEDILTITEDGELKLYENVKNCRFFDVTVKFNLGGQVFGKFCMVCDIDNDLIDEIIVFNGEHVESSINIFKRDGLDKKYYNASKKYSSIITERQINSAAYLDYNNDRKIDLIYCFEKPDGVENSVLLFENTGTGFKDITNESGLNLKDKFVSVAVGDVNMDERQDIYFASEDGTCFLMENKEGHFLDIARENGVELNNIKSKKMAVFIDNDNDGDPDLFVYSKDKLIRFLNFRNTANYVKIFLKHLNLNSYICKTNNKVPDDTEYRQLNGSIFPVFHNPVDLYFGSRALNSYKIIFASSKNNVKEMNDISNGKIEF